MGDINHASCDDRDRDTDSTQASTTKYYHLSPEIMVVYRAGGFVFSNSVVCDWASFRQGLKGKAKLDPSNDSNLLFAFRTLQIYLNTHNIFIECRTSWVSPAPLPWHPTLNWFSTASA